MDYKESKYTIDIAKDIMTAFKTWHKEKHNWYVKNVQGFTSDSEDDAMVTSVSVIRVKNHKHVIIGLTYRTGRHNNKYYRMLQSAFHKWCNDKVIKAIERKYKVTAEFQDLGNHNPNPELKPDTQKIEQDTEAVIETKSVVRWSDIKTV